MKNILNDSLNKAISLEQYETLFEQLVQEGKTTGPNQSEGYVNYTKLNWKRYQLALKHTLVSQATHKRIQSIDSDTTLLIITEAWCGDAAQILPVIDIMQRFNCKLDVKIVLRDENPELIDLFLTNGGKAIPKIIALDNDLNIIGDWGPRPSKLQALVREAKTAKPDITGIEISHFTQDWYKENRGKMIQDELLSIIENVFSEA